MYYLSLYCDSTEAGGVPVVCLSGFFLRLSSPLHDFPSYYLKPLNSPVVSCEELKVPLVFFSGSEAVTVVEI